MAACISPYCQKDPVLVCTAESKQLRLLSACTASCLWRVWLHFYALVQVGKYKPAQRAATVAYRGAQFFGVSFVASMVGHSLTKYMVSLSSILSQGTIVLHRTLGTVIAVVRFVHRAAMQFSLLTKSRKICICNTLVGRASSEAPLLRVDRLRTPSLRVSSRPTTFDPVWRRINSGVDCHGH